MSLERTWTVEIVFTEEGDVTRADAVLREGRVHVHGWGRSRRAPEDPNVPVVGEEIAAARALSDAAHKLIELAAERIEAWEGHAVRVHA